MPYRKQYLEMKRTPVNRLHGVSSATRAGVVFAPPFPPLGMNRTFLPEQGRKDPRRNQLREVGAYQRVAIFREMQVNTLRRSQQTKV